MVELLMHHCRVFPTAEILLHLKKQMSKLPSCTEALHISVEDFKTVDLGLDIHDDRVLEQIHWILGMVFSSEDKMLSMMEMLLSLCISPYEEDWEFAELCPKTHMGLVKVYYLLVE